MGKKVPLVSSIEDFVSPEPMTGCWLWSGAWTPSGYGVLRSKRAHRAVYEFYRGPIPRGLQLDHVCRTKCCVNPWHMEAVTGLENCSRYSASRTHCSNGHLLTPENTFRVGRKRRCYTCSLIAQAAFRRRSGQYERGQKKVCKRGHPLTDENSYLLTSKTTGIKYRLCKTCRLAKNKEYYSKRRGVA